MTTRHSDSADQVWTLIEKIKIAMVVSHDSRGEELRTRPMAAHPDRNRRAIYFLTDAGSGKVAEVAGNREICLAFADPQASDYLSLTGLASLSDDRALIKQLWSIAERAFWRDENDPAIRVLRVDPREAEYWRGPGTFKGYFKTFVALLSGGKPQLRDNEKVLLSSPPSAPDSPRRSSDL